MKKRVITIAAIALIGVGLWLSNFFKGLGFGLGEGDGAGVGQGSGANTVVSVPSDAATATSPEAAAAAQAAARNADPDEVLTVLVAKDRYQVQSGRDDDAEFDPATIEDIVERAKALPGDENGLRVRLRFRDTAQMGATTDLYEALQTAGIRREEIIEDPDAVK